MKIAMRAFYSLLHFSSSLRHGSRQTLRLFATVVAAVLLVFAPAVAWADSASVTSVSPSTLHTSGGQTITLDGTNLANIKQVSSNFNHSLALTHDGKVYAWGEGGQGQLGNGGTSDSSVPVLVDATGVMAGKTIVGVAAGALFSLAYSDEGDVYAWGDNVFGQLGDWTAADSSVPVIVDLVGDVVQVAAGAWTAYALLGDGTMYAWGRGNTGQLGDGTMIHAFHPMPVTLSGTLAGKKIIQMAGSTADEFVSVLTDDGTVHSWGSNSNGQQGTGAVGGSSNLPSAAAAGDITGKQIVQIIAGAYHVLAIDDAGKVYSWGDNERGQLGDGTTTDSPLPIAVQTAGMIDGKQTETVGASGFASYAVTSDGVFYSWGQNADGQLARDTSPYPETATPGATTVTGVRQVAGGLNYALAYTDTGTVLAWGQNADGQLGTGDTTGLPTATLVEGLLAPLYAIPTVLVGGVAATNVVLLDDGQITFTAPPHEAGAYDVVLMFADGRTTQVLGALTYAADVAPLIPSAPSAGFAFIQSKLTLVVVACFVLAGALVVIARRLKRS